MAKFNWQSLQPAHVLGWLQQYAPHLVGPLTQHLQSGQAPSLQPMQPMVPMQPRGKMGRIRGRTGGFANQLPNPYQSPNDFYDSQGQIRPGFTNENGEMIYNPYDHRLGKTKYLPNASQSFQNNIYPPRTI
jgi:hypothetical protein